ncbi:MAG TPA: mechanosensitive ion channel family protein [Elusimicrobiales bacterium]|nr:mechanosensitive ion channel family protein [Elusimicrobiales bacterium]
MEIDRLAFWFNNTVIAGNTPFAYLCAATAFTAAIALLMVIKTVGLARLKALAQLTETDLDDLAITLLEKIQRLDYMLAAFFIATRYLRRAPAFNTALNITLIIIFTYRAVTMIQHLLSYWIEKTVAGRGLSKEAKDSVMYGAQVLLRALVWAAAVLFVLDNLGVNITTLIAGLGIGGVAVALAAQAILGDLFNFFVILLDKPFRTGDFIVSDAIEGTIEHVGIKSTRLRSISGELIIVSNSKLLAGGLRNYNQMTRRRVAFRLSAIYKTPPEKLRRIGAIIKGAVTASPAAEFDRSNLAACAASSLDFETVYYVTGGDYGLYTRTHEEILLRILDGLNAEGIELAYPTQTVFVRQQLPA